MRKAAKVFAFGLIGIGAFTSSFAFAGGSCWGTIGIKAWNSTLSPGEGLPTTTGNIPMLTLGGGCKDVFVTVATSANHTYADPTYPGGGINHLNRTLNLGYFFTPEFSGALGFKRQRTSYGSSAYSNGIHITDRSLFATIGGAYNHPFDGTPYSINGNIAYGKTSLQSLSPINTGTLNASGSYLNYEIGAGYALTRSVRLSLGYRVEQFDDLVPTDMLVGATYAQPFTLAKQKIAVSGPVMGVAFAF